MPNYQEAMNELVKWNSEGEDMRFFQVSHMLADDGKKHIWEVTLFPEGDGWCKGEARSLTVATGKALANFKKDRREYPLNDPRNKNATVPQAN